MNNPLPSDLQRRWGNLPDIKQRGPAEWSSSCPQCGGAFGSRRDPSDRFRMFAGDAITSGRGWCRQCHYFAWVDDDQQRPDPEQVRIATAERLRLTELENQRIKDKLQKIADADFWRRWHDDMGPENRELWHRQGVIDYFIDYYSLGFCDDHTTYYNGQEWHSPTMTIPHYGPGWTLANIQHRLLNPPEPGDKYRQMAGVPAAMFLTEPDEPLTGAVLVVEGAKKAIISYTHLGTKENYSIVAIPGKTPSVDMLEKLDRCEPIYLALDPDAFVPHVSKDGRILPPAVNVVAKKLSGRAVLVKLPCKPDDLFTLYGGKRADFMAFLSQGIRA